MSDHSLPRDAAIAPVPRPQPQPRRKPLLSRVPAGFVRAVLKGHSSLGLAFAAAIYLVCLSGTIAVFAREFERWENPLAPLVATPAPAAVQAATAAAVARAGPDLEHVYIWPGLPDLPWLLVNIDAGGDHRKWVADGEGRLVAEAASPWTEFLTTLHIQLHLPRTWGAFLVGLTGVALLSSLISGVLAHPRVFRDAFHLRLGGSRRLEQADLHNRIGIWALPFHLIVSTTGALLGLTTLIVGVLGFALFQGDIGKVYGLFIPPEPKDNPAPAPMLDLRPMLAEIDRRVPGGRVTFVALEHPTEMGGAAMFSVQTTSSRLSNADSYAFDRTGKLYHQARASEKNLGERILGAIGALHFGWFGGGIVKIAYGLLGLGMTMLAASGVWIWLARRRDKGRPAPGWERIWSASVWGQVPALAAAAMVGVALPTVPEIALLALWGAATLGFLGAALAKVSPTVLSCAGRIGGAVLLVLAVLAQLGLRGGAGGDGVGLIVDLALLLIAGCLVAPEIKAWRRAAVAG